jgi:hypothetical protein
MVDIVGVYMRMRRIRGNVQQAAAVKQIKRLSYLSLCTIHALDSHCVTTRCCLLPLHPRHNPGAEDDDA